MRDLYQMGFSLQRLEWVYQQSYYVCTQSGFIELVCAPTPTTQMKTPHE